MSNSTNRSVIIEDSPIARFLFSDTRMAWFWLVVRVFLGWQWINSSLTKVGNPKWVQTGEALQGYWLNAVKIPEAPARPPITFDWYRSFIQGLLDAQAYTWFAKLVAYGELLIGIALIIGAFVGIAAFMGGFMNFNFIMAGSASSNGLLFVLATWLVLSWKIAGYIGADRYLLKLLGTPWAPGKLIEKVKPVGAEARA